MLRRRFDLLLLTMKQTKKLTICALCGALGVIFLYLGVILNMLDMSAAVLASLLFLFCVLELGYGYGFAVYVMISVLGFIVLPSVSPAVMFLGLFGYVPITKFGFERIFKKFSWVPKLILHNGVFALFFFLFGKFLGFTTENNFGIPASVIVVIYFVLANALFFLCDVLYARLVRIYLKKYREKIWKYLK
jgi:hypothetical protein